MSEAPNRRNVRKFFFYRVKKEQPERPVNVQLVVVIGLLALLFGAASGNMAAGIILGLIGAGITLAIDRAQASSAVQTSRDEVGEDHTRFLELAGETRKIQSADLTTAMMRVFERSQLDREKLRILDQAYVFPEEERLLDDDSKDRKFGDLMNKSLRMISPGKFSNEAARAFRWSYGERMEYFFNPVRLVMLFLTDTQLVVCEVEVDSMDGNIREDIQRVALGKIVNVRFTAERVKIQMSREELIQLAEDLQLNEDQIADIRRTVGYDTTPADGWRQEKVDSTLYVSRVDSGVLELPIRRQIIFGKTGALDEDARLDDDEIKMDRMVNELNRLVESG